jgi:hypothetical protein
MVRIEATTNEYTGDENLSAVRKKRGGGHVDKG